MPRRGKLDLDKIRASLNVNCPHCGTRIPPEQQSSRRGLTLTRWSARSAISASSPALGSESVPANLSGFDQLIRRDLFYSGGMAPKGGCTRNQLCQTGIDAHCVWSFSEFVSVEESCRLIGAFGRDFALTAPGQPGELGRNPQFAFRTSSSHSEEFLPAHGSAYSGGGEPCRRRCSTW